MNVALKPDAVDCARLISIVTSQMHECLQGKRMTQQEKESLCAFI